MAAASDDEETNYWPGFVDALSTMTMMLIFLMMILSLVVVSISQQTTKSQIMVIAKAAKVDTTATPATIEKLTAQILEALARSSDATSQNTPAPEPRQTDETPLADPNPNNKFARSKDFSVEEGSKTAAQGIDDPQMSNSKSSVADIEAQLDESDKPSANPPRSSQTAELDPQAGKYYFASPQPNPDESRIVSRHPADLEAFGGGTDVKVNPALVTVEFQPRAIQCDDNSLIKLKDFIDSRREVLGGRRMQVRALANVRDGAVTEARRFSYYRAMGIRQVLINLGIPAGLISVGIEDVSDPDKTDIVELFAS